jgi:hypothetical protein
VPKSTYRQLGAFLLRCVYFSEVFVVSKEVNPQSGTPEPSLPVPKYDLDLDALAKVTTPKLPLAEIANAFSATNKIGQQIADMLKASSPMLDAVKAFSEQKNLFSDLVLPSITTPEPLIPHDFHLTPVENPTHETNRKLNKVIELLALQAEQSSQLSAPNFDEPSCSIIFGNKLIPIPRSSNQELLCKSLFKNLSRQWEWSELLEDWGDEEWTKEGWRKIYEAARAINEHVAKKTTVEDFLLNSKKVTAVNPKYLGTG